MSFFLLTGYLLIILVLIINIIALRKKENVLFSCFSIIAALISTVNMLYPYTNSLPGKKSLIYIYGSTYITVCVFMIFLVTAFIFWKVNHPARTFQWLKALTFICLSTFTGIACLHCNLTYNIGWWIGIAAIPTVIVFTVFLSTAIILHILD